MRTGEPILDELYEGEQSALLKLEEQVEGKKEKESCLKPNIH